MRKILVIFFCVLFLNGCIDNREPGSLNYDDFYIINYQNKNYHMYQGYNNNRYEFWGKYEKIGKYTSDWTAQGFACILVSDVNENIVFADNGSYFWIKEGYNFINRESEIKRIILSNNSIYSYENVEISFEIEDLTYNKIGELIVDEIDIVEEYSMYFDYGEGIVLWNYLCKTSEGNYYFRGEYYKDKKLKYDWYKIPEQYAEVFTQKILEYEEIVK